MMNLDEEHFIPQLSIDSVIFGYWDSRLKVLIAKVKMDYDIWTLPGGFIQQREHIDAAAMRILEERTGLNKIYLEQFRVFGAENRVNDSFQEKVKTWQNIGSNFELEKMLRWFSKRFVSIGYYALVDINKVSLRKGEFDNSVEWYDIENLPVMIMDHNEMVNFALEKLREKLDEKLIGFNLLPETFTMRELQELYEVVYDRPFPRNNFQKKMLDLNVLERLEKVYTGAANKAPFLYRFRKGD